MVTKNGFGKCGETFERGVPDSMAICSPSDEATRIAGIFSWGKTLPWIGVASSAQKEFTKPVFLWRGGAWWGLPVLVGALIPGFGQKELTAITAAAAGGLIAFYQIGYDIAAFGVGPLQTWAGLDLNIIYGGTAAVALAMAALSFDVTPAQDVNKR